MINTTAILSFFTLILKLLDGRKNTLEKKQKKIKASMDYLAMQREKHTSELSKAAAASKKIRELVS